MKKLICIFFVLLSIAPVWGNQWVAEKGSSSSQELVQLSDWLGKLQQELTTHAIDTIWIGGGAARAILDHLYFKKPLVMRDLDVFVVADREVTASFVEKIGSHLDGDEFGYFSREDLRNRPRVPTDQPVLTRNQYVAGFGLHWIRSNGEILDLSVYHSKEDLDLNGIFDIDTVMIPLSSEMSLIEFAQKAEELPYQMLVDQQRVYDRYSGYAEWVAKRLRLVNWLDIESDSLLKVMRVVRTLFKMERPAFNEEESKNFQHLFERADVQNPLQMTRSLLKVLEDREALEELAELKRIGLFQKWLTPFLDLDFQTLTFNEVKPLEHGRGSKEALANLKHLIKQLPSQQKRLEAIARILSCYDLELCGEWFYDELFHDSLVDPQPLFTLIKEADGFAKRLTKIGFSTVLSDEARRELFLRALVFGKSEKEAEKKLQRTFPTLSASLIKQAASKSQTLRRGLFVGIFNPVHHGHLDTIQEAIVEMALDECIVAPVSGSGVFYEQAVSWQDRYAMLNLALQRIVEAKLAPKEFEKAMLEGEEAITRMLIKQDPDAEWVRLVGSDYFPEYCRLGLFKHDPCSEMLVIQRDQDPIILTEKGMEKRVHVKKHLPGTCSLQKRHQAKHARNLASQGKDPSSFVPKPVAEYILKHRLYQTDAPLFCITTNERKCQAVQKVFPEGKKLGFDIPTDYRYSCEEAVQKKLQKAMELEINPVLVVEHFVKIKALSEHFIPISDLTLKSLGPQNLALLMEAKQNHQAVFLTLVGFAKKDEEARLLKKMVKGRFDPRRLKEENYLDIEEQFFPEGSESPLLENHPLGEVLFDLKRQIRPEKIGFMTGVFNPVHYGHLEGALESKKRLGLDRVILIPTLATTHNEKPIAWEERVELVEKAVEGIDGLEVVSRSFKPFLEQGTGKMIEALFKQSPKGQFFHLMGSDSFERFAKQGRLEKALPERYEIIVIERPGFPLEKTTHPKVHVIEGRLSIGQEERASSTVRRRLQEGSSIAHLVPPKVEEAIKEKGLFSSTFHEIQ